MTSPLVRTPSRRTVVSAAAGAVATGLVAGSTSPAAAASTSAATDRAGLRRNADRAAVSWQALLTHLAAHDGSGLYRERIPVQPDDPEYSYEWPFSQVHVAALDLTGMAAARELSPDGYVSDLAAHTAAQQHYWAETSTTGFAGFLSGPVAPWAEGGDLFYDDNLWVGLLDVQQHAMTGDRRALAEARRISELVDSGWDDDPSHPAPGGVFWTQAPWSQDRNTVSNMPAAELDLRLFQVTGEKEYLDRAVKYQRWTTRYLQRPDGLFHDHIDLAGEVEKTVWSYNQGVPVGVGVLLHQITGKRKHLDEARRTAHAALAFYGRDDLDAQPPYFNSIFFKNLLLLESVTGGHTYRRAMADYADRMWSEHRDPTTGLFSFPGDDGVAEGTETIAQAAMVQVFAVLAWPPEKLGLLY